MSEDDDRSDTSQDKAWNRDQDKALYKLEKRVDKLEWQFKTLSWFASAMSTAAVLLLVQELFKLGL